MHSSLHLLPPPTPNMHMDILAEVCLAHRELSYDDFVLGAPSQETIPLERKRSYSL